MSEPKGGFIPALFKRCSDCEEVKPHSDFYRNKSNSKDGLQSTCKSCTKARVAAYQKSNRDKMNRWNKAYRERNPEKTRERQHRFNNSEHGKRLKRESAARRRGQRLEAQRRWREKNAEAIKEYKQRRYQERKEEAKARAQMHKGIKNHLGRSFLAPKGWRLCIRCRYILPVALFSKNQTKCKECASALSKANYQENREERRIRGRAYYRKNRKRLLKQKSEYAKRNRVRDRPVRQAAKARRRARELGAEGSYTAAEFKAKLEAYKNRCHWCRKKIKGTPHADHLIALSRGGTNYISNIVPACASCNLSKSAQLPHEFSGRLL